MLAFRSTASQRFEFKYLIDEPTAELVRGFALCHLRPDSHADRAHHYPVYSLYLDSGGLRLYHSSCSGQQNRFKLRVRYYDADPDTPAFLEVKARKNDVIQKHRAPVRKDSLGWVLGSYCPSAVDLMLATPGGVRSLERFCELGAALAATPRVIVRYDREAYAADDGGRLRLTMDRRITCLPMDAPSIPLDGPGWLSLRNRWIVLEVKFNDTFPRWAYEMVRALNLMRVSTAKYVESIRVMNRVGVA